MNTGPGEMVFARMPSGPSSCDMDWVIPYTPGLAGHVVQVAGPPQPERIGGDVDDAGPAALSQRGHAAGRCTGGAEESGVTGYLAGERMDRLPAAQPGLRWPMGSAFLASLSAMRTCVG